MRVKSESESDWDDSLRFPSGINTSGKGPNDSMEEAIRGIRLRDVEVGRKWMEDKQSCANLAVTRLDGNNCRKGLIHEDKGKGRDVERGGNVPTEEEVHGETGTGEEKGASVEEESPRVRKPRAPSLMPPLSSSFSNFSSNR